MSIKRGLVDLAGVTAFPADPQFIVPFEPSEGITIVNMSAADAEVSLNGADVHGTILKGNGLKLAQRSKKVWLRRTTVGAASTPIELIAED